MPDLQIRQVLERGGDMFGVLERARHPIDASLEPAHPQSGVAIENPAEDVLPECISEWSDRLEHADADGVELVRRRRRALTDVVRDRDLRLFDRVPYTVHR